MLLHSHSFIFFFFNDTATTEIYTLSLHDALPICNDILDARGFFNTGKPPLRQNEFGGTFGGPIKKDKTQFRRVLRSEEHTSELQSQSNLVCRLLLEKKKTDHVTSLTHLRKTTAHA